MVGTLEEETETVQKLLREENLTPVAVLYYEDDKRKTDHFEALGFFDRVSSNSDRIVLLSSHNNYVYGFPPENNARLEIPAQNIIKYFNIVDRLKQKQ